MSCYFQKSHMYNNINATTELLLLLKKVGRPRLGKSDLHPISKKNTAPQCQPNTIIHFIETRLQNIISIIIKIPMAWLRGWQVIW